MQSQAAYLIFDSGAQFSTLKLCRLLNKILRMSISQMEILQKISRMEVNGEQGDEARKDLRERIETLHSFPDLFRFSQISLFYISFLPLHFSLSGIKKSLRLPPLQLQQQPTLTIKSHN
jgi:hypothetical protein